jgi:TPR repeat protein
MLFDKVRTGGKVEMTLYQDLVEAEADNYIRYQHERDLIGSISNFVDITGVEVSCSLQDHDPIGRYSARAESVITLVVRQHKGSPTFETVFRSLGQIAVSPGVSDILRYTAKRGCRWVVDVLVEQAPQCKERDFLLGELWGLLKNEAASLTYYMAAAEQGHATAHLRIALQYPSPTTQVINHLTRAGELGSSRAWEKLGELCEKTDQLPEAFSYYCRCSDAVKWYHQSRFSDSGEQAREFLTKAAGAGSTVAIYELATAHVREQAFEEAFGLYVQIALLDGRAAVGAGKILEMGIGVPKDTRLAEAYFEYATTKDLPEAYYRLALLRAGENQASLSIGQQSQTLFRRAGEYPGALYELAQLVLPGRKLLLLKKVVTLDPSDPAAAAAAFALAEMYRGPQRDLTLVNAVTLSGGTHRAALMEIGKACARKGEHGDAFRYFVKSLRQGETDEIRRLVAGCYRGGLGVTQDEGLATYWAPPPPPPRTPTAVATAAAAVDSDDPCLAELCGRLLPGRFTDRRRESLVFSRCDVRALVMDGQQKKVSPSSEKYTLKRLVMPLSDEGVPLVVCANCRRPDRCMAFQRCGRCKEVFYCSTQCQREHWTRPVVAHKETCVPKVCVDQRFLDAKGVFLWQLLMHHEHKTAEVPALKRFREELTVTPVVAPLSRYECSFFFRLVFVGCAFISCIRPPGSRRWTPTSCKLSGSTRVTKPSRLCCDFAGAKSSQRPSKFCAETRQGCSGRPSGSTTTNQTVTSRPSLSPRRCTSSPRKKQPQRWRRSVPR